MWRCPRCLGWAAKETRLPARRPPLRMPWCRAASSLTPHPPSLSAQSHWYYLQLNDTTICISTWNHHYTLTHCQFPYHFFQRTKYSISLTLVTRQTLISSVPCKNHLGMVRSRPKSSHTDIFSIKMATFKNNDPTNLTSPPWNTVIFINFHRLIIDQTLLLTFEHK